MNTWDIICLIYYLLFMLRDEFTRLIDIYIYIYILKILVI